MRKSTPNLFVKTMLKLYALLLMIGLWPTPAAAQSVSQPSSQPEAAPPAFDLNTAGICWLYNLSGYLALDTVGEVVPLQPYCQQQRNWAWYNSAPFWQQFRQVATVETLRYSQSLDPDAIEAYGQTICLFFKDGGSAEQLAEIQSDSTFPAKFEQAVTVAALNSLCRQYHQLYRL
ncbi:hypothetical protein [Rivularia sp. UHCC 0363]|uniref:hypothetical protein n=1 Tax=Rivularia sp. UHCC 0363 TaxID=3110244 RepID=UPI002B203AB7|nr:hypothetical protein [Rivularia sp. UHCC 0363]MEA5597472.1 hypothetical protein [Rivularia sp. UHCC 0363]